MMKQIWNTMFKRLRFGKTYDYSYNINKAIENTKELGLSPYPFFAEASMVYSDETKQAIIKEIIQYFYEEKNYKVDDIALKCFWISHELQTFLKDKLNIISHVTTGNVYRNNGGIINYESLKDIKKRLSHSIETPVKSHTWLTLENHTIIDLVMPANFYFVTNDPIFLNKVALIKPPFDENSMVYEPMIMGYEYFEKIKVNPQVHLVYSN